MDELTWVTIALHPDSDDLMVVKSTQYTGIEEVVDLSPSPTWPSPSESNDLIVEAVRKVLDRAWEAASGEPVER